MSACFSCRMVAARCYLELLCHAHAEHGIPEDANRIRLLLRRGCDEWPAIWTQLEQFWPISRDPATFSSATGTNIFEVHGQELSTIQSMLINMDPPGHGKYRRLVNRGLTPRMVAALEPHIRELTRTIVDHVAAKGECDFVAEVAAELPLLVLAEFLGLPEDDRRKVYDWSNRLIGFDDPEFQQSMNDGKLAAMEVWAYASELAERRRREPGDDLVSLLLQGDIDGERLSEKDFTNFFLLLAVAGNETTRNLVAAGMLALIQHPRPILSG